MKKLIACLAFAPFAFAVAKAATFEEVSKAVKPDAFEKADKGWRRLMTVRNSNCGEIGNSGVTRLDVIINAYEPLAIAVSANDAAGAMTAGEAFSQRVLQNTRFTSCWESISSRVGLSPSLPNMFQ